MTSAFSAYDAILSQAEEAHLGELMRFSPAQRRDNYGKPAGATDARQPVDVIGTFIEGGAGFEFLAGDKRNSDFSARVLNQEAWASVDRSYFLLGNSPQKGDTLQMLDQPVGTIFEILDVVNYGDSRFAFPLVRK